MDRSGPEFSVHIAARTDDGREVMFRHDEIRDWHDNIRIDYGYAMTIASAQGLTVDRAFLLVDDRPARETIYPAATRHREGIDVYVNRSPLDSDIADRRPEDQADMPITDSDVRAYLAGRWSRSQPKEAALDYTTDGEWREERRHGPALRDGRGEPAEAREAANDNAIVRIAQEIRHTVNAWRHGAAVDAFATERAEVLAAWQELRERTRAEGEAVALSDNFSETLDRHGALMKHAASFRSRPRAFERLLAERVGIGQHELAELGELHARAGRYLRSVKATASHAAQRDASHEELGNVEAIGAQTAAPAAKPAPEERAPPRPAEEAAPGQRRNATPDWRTLYKELQRDWNDLVARSEKPDLPLPLMDGYDRLIERVRQLAAHPDLTQKALGVLAKLLSYHESETVARQTAGGYLESAESHVELYRTLTRQAEEQGIPITELANWPKWREAAETLAPTGEAILSNEEKYGAYLDAITIGKSRARLTVERLRNRLHKPRVEAPKPEETKSRPSPAPKQEQGFAHVLDDPEKLRELREKAEEQDRKLGKHQRRSRDLSM